jgi:hypothetical protein
VRVQKQTKEPKKPKEPRISIACLKQKRGWTEALIQKFLGAPDATAPNPHYRSGSPMKLYLLKRVEETEKLPEFVVAKEKASKRSQTGKRVQATLATKLIERAWRLPLQITKYANGAVLHFAIEDYNDWHSDFDNFVPATPKSDRDFLERIQVNYIRHQLTQYDDSLEEVAGKAGVSEAIRVIRTRIYAAIAKAYPQLAAKCQAKLHSLYGKNQMPMASTGN